jgi:transcription elongation factor GreA
MSDSHPMTPAGLEKLRSELDHIRRVDRPENVRDIEAAREHGDLRENAEYHAAKDRQGALDARLRYLEARIANAQVIDPVTITSTTIGFGATVTLLEVETEAQAVYAIVGEDESDVGRGRISITSPIARALLRKSVGDEVVVHLPRGERAYEVLKIEYKALEEREG